MFYMFYQEITSTDLLGEEPTETNGFEVSSTSGILQASAKIRWALVIFHNLSIAFPQPSTGVYMWFVHGPT